MSEYVSCQVEQLHNLEVNLYEIRGRWSDATVRAFLRVCGIFRSITVTPPFHNHLQPWPSPHHQDSSVGKATRYGLNSPGIESRWRRDFPHLSRPALGTTQLPIQ